MANYILKNSEVLLRLNNAALYFFYENIVETAKTLHMLEAKEINDILSMLDQDIWGFGNIKLNLSEKIHSPNDLKVLQQLIEKTVDKIKKEKLCIQESIDRFEEFKNKFCALTFEELAKQ